MLTAWLLLGASLLLVVAARVFVAAEFSFVTVDRTKVAQAYPDVGSKMLFLFDYGDEWRFKVEVIGLGEKVPKARYPKVLNRVYLEKRSFSSSGSRRSLTQRRSATAQGS